MNLEPDLLLDRRRLKRHLFAWRLLTVIVAVLAVGIAMRAGGFPASGKHVARVTVSGLITEDRKLNQAVEALAKDDSVPAVILYVNSPGGSVAGGESLHKSIGRVAAKKPVVAVMGGVAASAGYMVALPAARIFAREGTLTGSIGVLLETAEVSGLLKSIGVDAEAITSGPLKNQPSFFHPLSPQGREVLNGLVMDMYDQFVGMVAAGRHLEADRVRQLADGRAFTGRQALQLGLIDQIGGEPDAREWLAKEKGVSVDVRADDVSTSGLAERALLARLNPVLDGIARTLVTQALSLDGAWALWQPSRQ
jgi:protease IV